MGKWRYSFWKEGRTKKEEMIDKTRVYNCDCLPAMREFPDKYFDLAIVDPPFGNESSFNNRRGLRSFENIEPPAEYYIQLTRISTNQIVWGINYLCNCNFKGGGIVWNKLGTHTEHRLQAPTIGDAELAYQSFTQNVKIFSYGWMGNVTGNGYVINSDESRQRFHPTQKPVALYKWLLKNYAKEGDKILDSHVGSGSSRIAAYDGGFEYVGYELDTDYFNAQEKRFNNHKSQLRLFV